MLLHIEDQDLWRFALPGTRAFCRGLRLQPFAFTIWHALMSQTPTTDAPRYLETLAHGTAIETYFQREIEGLAESHLRMPAQLRANRSMPCRPCVIASRSSPRAILAWLAVHGIAVAVNANALFASGWATCSPNKAVLSV